jgi:hypothetical protein
MQQMMQLICSRKCQDFRKYDNFCQAVSSGRKPSKSAVTNIAPCKKGIRGSMQQLLQAFETAEAMG